MPRVTESVDYLGIPNDSLRRFLNSAEEQIGKIEKWPFLVSELELSRRFSHQLGVERQDIHSLYNLVRAQGVLEFEKKKEGENTRYSLDKENLRVFMALCCWVKDHPGAGNKRNRIRDIRIVVSETRQALGQNPLANLLHDPQRNGPQNSEPEVVILKGASSDPVRPKRLFERRSQPAVEQLNELKKWTSKKLASLLAEISSRHDLDEIGIPTQAVMFIHAANAYSLGRTEKYDQKLEGLSNHDLREGIRVCLAYMERYPKLETLADLFRVITRVVEKNGW